MHLGVWVLVAASVLASLGWNPVHAQAPDPDPPAQAHALRQVISMMEAEAAELEPRLETARGQLADLTRQIAEVTERLEAGRTDLIRLQTDQDRIKAAIAEGQAEQDRQAAAIKAEQAELTARIDDLRTQAQAEDAAIQTARTNLAELTAQVEAARATLAQSQDLAGQIAEQESRLGELTENVRQLTAELTALTRVRDAALAQPEPQPEPETVPQAAAAAGGGGTPDLAAPGPRRDPGQVDAALALAPALPAASGRARLRDLLVQGHCTTDALRQVQNPINRQTLLVLVGRLGGC